MVRTQLQIDDITYELLRETAHKQKRSMSAVVRDILQQQLGTSTGAIEPPARTALHAKYTWIGMGKSGETDLSVHHDDYLAEEPA
ncbi:MAG: ribbon-helix-helix protein, CopG family [Armatimonadota bacterium]